MLDWLFPDRNKPKTLPAEPLADYPSADDAAQARAGGYGYGDPQSAYIEGKAGSVFGGFKEGTKVDPFVAKPPIGPGGLSNSFNLPQVNAPGKTGISSGLLRDQQDDYTRASLASNYVPIAALGLEGRNTTADMSEAKKNILGAYSPKQDKLWFSHTDPNSLLHESTHRGLAQLSKDPRTPWGVNTRNPDVNEELLVRQLMQRYGGDPERKLFPADVRASVVSPDQFPAQDLAKANDLVAQIMKERRPRGPR